MKNSSLKPTVGQLPVVCRPTVGRQSVIGALSSQLPKLYCTLLYFTLWSPICMVNPSGKTTRQNARETLVRKVSHLGEVFYLQSKCGENVISFFCPKQSKKQPTFLALLEITWYDARVQVLYVHSSLIHHNPLPVWCMYFY